MWLLVSALYSVASKVKIFTLLFLKSGAIRA